MCREYLHFAFTGSAFWLRLPKFIQVACFMHDHCRMKESSCRRFSWMSVEAGLKVFFADFICVNDRCI